MFLAPLLFQPFLTQNRAPVVTSIRISHGRFESKTVRLTADGTLRFQNDDPQTYTVEAPGLLPGDVMVPAGATVEATPLYEAGKFTAMIEEVPSSEVEIVFAGRPITDPLLREPPFDMARRHDRQPLLFEPGEEPAYGAYTSFNLAGKGETARQGVLQDLYRVEESLSGEKPPSELAPYLTRQTWMRLRPSVALVVGLGPSVFDGKRFGAKVAASRPAGLHPFMLAHRLGVKMPAGRDVLLRVTSDSQWFNLRVCRLVWSRLRGRIGSPTLESGYTPPRGRSPILGGFFDGIGNPSGAVRDRAVYGGGNGTILALFRIEFDEARFTGLSLAQQESIVGRKRESGHLMKKAPEAAHRVRAQNDGKSVLVRMPLVFDDGPNNVGLLFASAQPAIDSQFERILRLMLAKGPKGKKDSLLDFMRFESGAYYYIPSSNRGSYPGSLRGG